MWKVAMGNLRLSRTMQVYKTSNYVTKEEECRQNLKSRNQLDFSQAAKLLYKKLDLRTNYFTEI